MKTVNSISGGKTSAYIAKHYPADIDIFSLVRIDDKECLWMNGKDEKTRQLISDRIRKEFIGTAEMDDIIYTILDLEQFLGTEIKIISGIFYFSCTSRFFQYLNSNTPPAFIPVCEICQLSYLRPFR